VAFFWAARRHDRSRAQCRCLRYLKAISAQLLKAEKIEQLMGVTWEVEESAKLRGLAEKILRLAEIGESETSAWRLGNYVADRSGRRAYTQPSSEAA
jgi:hypothetical protein